MGSPDRHRTLRTSAQNPFTRRHPDILTPMPGKFKSKYGNSISDPDGFWLESTFWVEKCKLYLWCNKCKILVIKTNSSVSNLYYNLTSKNFCPADYWINQSMELYWHMIPIQFLPGMKHSPYEPRELDLTRREETQPWTYY